MERPRVSVAGLRVEHRPNGQGIGTGAPRLSWIAETASQDWRQAAYELRLLREDGSLRATTGQVATPESVLVAWPFAPLRSRKRVAVSVRVWGEDGSESDWSDPLAVEAALLSPDDWSARFVSPAETANRRIADSAMGRPALAVSPSRRLAVSRPPLLRREFTLGRDVESARLYVTALGVYELEINGRVVGDEVLAPGWTSYGHRLRYATHDVTELLRPGGNAIGAMLGDGWYRGRLGWNGGRRNVYGDRLALLAQLEVVYADGTSETIVTDESWRSASGPVVASDLYDGETYDARLERPGWSSTGYDDAEWDRVEVVERDLATLFAPTGPPVRRTAEVRPVSIARSPSGKTIVDFGQNLVGRLRITVNGEAGRSITLRHAEVLEDGELCIRPLRQAAATDRYSLKGGGPETWEPRFTFHGFRYAEVDGWPGELTADDLIAVVCHSDLERRGWFECSDDLLNRFHENVVWSMRGNFLDVPTDCPQRDERLGWTGDIQVFAPTASFLFDSAGFLASWLRDLAADQAADGGVPWVVPNPLPGPLRPAAAWGDAAAIVPWTLCQRYGDRQVLADQFDSMRAWVDWIADVAGPSRLWSSGHQFGDWLDPDAPPDKAGQAKTDRYLVATAYFARSAELVGRAAELLDRDDEARRYLALAEEVRAAFDREYLSPNGRAVSDAPTAYALALEFALLREEPRRRRAGQRLAELVRASGYRVSTGFVGTPLICDALCSVGEVEAAYRLLTQRECPSWLYPVTMGATTIWERWDSLRPDGTVNPGEMTSFNHYALGAVADFLHRVVAGLAPAEPGYRRLLIAPTPGGGLTHARARHRTPYGLAECGWRIDGEEIEVTAMVPPNTRAEVRLPGRPGPLDVGSGSYRWRVPLPS